MSREGPPETGSKDSNATFSGHRTNSQASKSANDRPSSGTVNCSQQIGINTSPAITFELLAASTTIGQTMDGLRRDAEDRTRKMADGISLLFSARRLAS
jgi:hypothetical protein